MRSRALPCHLPDRECLSVRWGCFVGVTPSQAVAACKTLVQDKHVFLLVGAAGTDQIVECAKYAATAHIPYLAE